MISGLPIGKGAEGIFLSCTKVLFRMHLGKQITEFRYVFIFIKA